MNINFKNILQKLINNLDLTADEMTATMHDLMNGQLTEAQIGAYLTALTMKGESITELTSATQVMRTLATNIEVKARHLIDVVGTGGDKKNTFNISTATAFVVAAAGGTVAKHGNRSVSSQTGSADVLENAGMPLSLTPQQVTRCIEKLNIGFLFAPTHHQAMKYALGPRRELGIRTIFNLLGPLTNPANAKFHLIGVFHEQWLRPFAEVLKILGSERALIVHSIDGMDEISIVQPTFVTELNDGGIRDYFIRPEEFGLWHPSLDDLTVQDAAQSLMIIKRVFDNIPGPAKDIVTLNSGAAIYAAKIANNLADGIKKAQAVIESGAVKKLFRQFIDFTQELKDK